MSVTSKDSRELLEAIGVGRFNATAIIPYMMISPATTDPKAGQIVILVQAVQRALYNLGAVAVPLAGRLDVQTAAALEQIVGPDWEIRPWFATVQAIVRAQESGQRIAMPQAQSMPVAVGGPLDFLPDVPGGLLTYALGGYLIYRHFTKRA